MFPLQVLDISQNRIRDLTKDSFSRYTDLKYLYLFENIIIEIENGTFSQLTGLEALDLSSNGLSTIPLELLYMDRLRNLYVAGNKLTRLQIDIDSITHPITSPFQVLSLANTFITKLPNFGILPDLWHLNLSNNALIELKFSQFQGLCGLKSVEFNSSIMPQCECRTIDFKLFERGVDIANLNCGVLGFSQNCRYDSEGEAQEEVKAALQYIQCLGIKQGRVEDKESRSRWLYIAASLFGFLVVFIGK